MTRANDNAAEAIGAIDYGPPVTLTGHQAHIISEALTESDRAHAAAMESRYRAISAPARAARVKVQHAWAQLRYARTGDPT